MGLRHSLPAEVGGYPSGRRPTGRRPQRSFAPRKRADAPGRTERQPCRVGWQPLREYDLGPVPSTIRRCGGVSCTGRGSAGPFHYYTTVVIATCSALANRVVRPGVGRWFWLGRNGVDGGDNPGSPRDLDSMDSSSPTLGGSSRCVQNAERSGWPREAGLPSIASKARPLPVRPESGCSSSSPATKHDRPASEEAKSASALGGERCQT